MRGRTTLLTGGRGLALAALGLCGALGAGAQSASDQVTVPEVKIGKTGRLEALVSVVNERGAPVPGLGAGNFVVTLDRQPVARFTVRPVRTTQQGISVVLAIDVSKSMKGERIHAARSAAARFVGSLGAEDRCALLAFGDSVKWLVGEFTEDRKAIQDQLRSLEATDAKTVLNEAFLYAAQKGDQRPTAHAAVVVMTDGRDDGSSINLDQAAREAQWRNVPIYALGFGSEIDHRALRQITTLTGGRFSAGRQATDLTRLYSTVLTQLSSQYALEFPAPGLRPGGHKLKVELRHKGAVMARDREFQVQGAAVKPAPVEPARPPKPSQEPGPAEGEGPPWGTVAVVAAVVALAGAGYMMLRRGRARPGVAAAAARTCVYCGRPLAAGEDLYCAACGGTAREGAGAEAAHPTAPPPITPPAPGAPWLEVLAGAHSGEQAAFPEDRPLGIGRGSTQDVIIEGDRRMSRDHAAISRDANGRFVLSNRSPNGTYVNNRRIEAPEVLQDGDRIGLGSEEAKVIFHDPRSQG